MCDVILVCLIVIISFLLTSHQRYDMPNSVVIMIMDNKHTLYNFEVARTRISGTVVILSAVRSNREFQYF